MYLIYGKGAFSFQSYTKNLCCTTRWRRWSACNLLIYSKSFCQRRAVIPYNIYQWYYHVLAFAARVACNLFGPSGYVPDEVFTLFQILRHSLQKWANFAIPQTENRKWQWSRVELQFNNPINNTHAAYYLNESVWLPSISFFWANFRLFAYCLRNFCRHHPHCYLKKSSCHRLSEIDLDHHFQYLCSFAPYSHHCCYYYYSRCCHYY